MGYSLCMMADFQNDLISRMFVVVCSVFLHSTTVNNCRMDFNLLFGILTFEQKWGFCMGYSLCMMADFQKI